MAACLAITLPLEVVLKARVYRRPLMAFKAIFTTALIFSIWDITAIYFDFWTYSEKFTTGIELPFNYPLEELVFFLVIPLCALLTYEGVSNVLAYFKTFRTQKPKASDA